MNTASQKLYIRRATDSAFKTSFNDQYESLISRIVGEITELLEECQDTLYVNVSTKFVPKLTREIEATWGENIKSSPGKDKTNVQQKNTAMINDINDLQEKHVTTYLEKFYNEIMSRAKDTINFYTKDVIASDRFSQPELKAIAPKYGTFLTASQPQPKLITKSMDEVDEVQDPEENKHLLVTGPLDQNDVTFYKLVHRDEYMGHLEQGLPIRDFPNMWASSPWKEEYDALERIGSIAEIQDMRYESNTTKNLNRYTDVIPYKSNFVKLQTFSDAIHPYINASYVSSSYKKDSKAFIVTQAPLESTKQDFWAMVVKEEVEMIVMLCKLQAGIKPQSCDYFGESSKIEFPWLKVTVDRAESPMINLVKRSITLQLRNGQQRKLVHYQWKGWPDHGVPEENQYNALVYLVKEMMNKKSISNKPMVVHCSAGIGRSGALVAIFNLAQILKRHNDSKTIKNKAEVPNRLSVFSTVRRLRSERYGMVQTLEQYELIYKVIALLIKNPRVL